MTLTQGLEEINWEVAGAKLANVDSTIQTKFFKAFVKECLSWGTRYQAESQLAYINMNLTEEEKQLLNMISFREEK